MRLILIVPTPTHQNRNKTKLHNSAYVARMHCIEYKMAATTTTTETQHTCSFIAVCLISIYIFVFRSVSKAIEKQKNTKKNTREKKKTTTHKGPRCVYSWSTFAYLEHMYVCADCNWIGLRFSTSLRSSLSSLFLLFNSFHSRINHCGRYIDSTVSYDTLNVYRIFFSIRFGVFMVITSIFVNVRPIQTEIRSRPNPKTLCNVSFFSLLWIIRIKINNLLAFFSWLLKMFGGYYVVSVTT